MDIYERYSEEDIEFVENLINTTHVLEISKLVQEATKAKKYWERYDKNKKLEADGGKLYINGEENSFMAGFFKAMHQNEKLSKEEEQEHRERYEYLKKIYDIIANDSDIQEEIGKKIEDSYYDENDEESRMNTLVILITALNAFKYSSENEYPKQEEKEKFDIILNAVNNVLQELNFADFNILYSSVSTRNFFENPIFTETIVSHIKRMSTDEFMQFCMSTQDDLDAGKKEIVDAKIAKAEELNEPAVTELLNTIHIPSRPMPDTDCITMDKIASLYRGQVKNKEEVYEHLTDSEFVLLLLKHKMEGAEFDPILFQNESTEKRINQLSRKNLMILTETFLRDYLQYHDMACRIKPEDINSTFNRKKQWECIIKKAQEEGLLSHDFEKQYTQEEIKNELDIYKDIISHKYKYFPRADTYFNTTIKENDSDFDALDMVGVWKKRFEKCNQSLQDTLSAYRTVNKLAKKEGLEALQETNRYNVELAMLYKSKSREESSKDLTISEYTANDLKRKLEEISTPIARAERNRRIEEPISWSKDEEPTGIEKYLSSGEKYVLNYYKKRILGMPEKFTAFFRIVDGGALTDVMKMKIDDLQYKLLNSKGNTDMQK